MNLTCVTYAEEPALKDVIFDAIKRHAWPEFMFHDPVAGRLWDFLENDFAEYQFVLKDDAGAPALLRCAMFRRAAATIIGVNWLCAPPSQAMTVPEM